MMRLYRGLLRLLPASFRAEYAGEMSAIFARRRRDASGPLEVAALWAATIADVVAAAVRVHLDVLGQDLRYAGRTLGRTPGFTATVIAVSALGIGATTAAFSVADHVLIRPLPFLEPHRLVKLWQDQSFRGYSRMELSAANFRDWERMSTSFEATAAFTGTSVNLVGEGEPERLDGVSGSHGLISVLGTPPLLGRSFGEAEDRPGASGTVVLSHRLWNRRFGADIGVLGRTVSLDGAPYEVIGVMPRGFHFPSRETDLWTTLRLGEADYEDRTDWRLRAVGRLKADVSLEQARAEMRLVAAQLERAHPRENARTGATVVRLRDEMNEQSRLLVLALFGAALCVLSIASTNLASLLLARALFRRKELAVRTALGAGRERLVRQLLTESLVLAAAGGVLGVLLASLATPLAARLVPHSLPIAEVPEADLRVLGFGALMTLTTGIGFGVMPAFRAFGRGSVAGLREGVREGIGGRREGVRSLLVLSEVTVSVVLLVCSGLLLRALWRVQAVDPGFRAEGILTLRTALPLPKYERTGRRQRFYDDVVSGVQSLPGVSAAAYVSFLPMVMRGGIWTVTLDGRPEDPGETSTASLRFVTPGFFETAAIPLRRGRDVGAGDTREKTFVAVVSESFVERHWPGQDPLGRRFLFAFQERTVVGVVGDIRVRGLEGTSEPQVYLPYQQVPDGGLPFYTPKDLLVRTTLQPETLVPAIRRIVAAADPEQAIANVRTLQDVVDEETAPRSVQVGVLGGFAGLALLLAGIGMHGLLAFTVSSRSQEFGVRIALGAGPRDVLGLVLRQGARLAAAGLVLGLSLAYAAGRGIEALLFGVSPRDAGTFLAAAVLVVAATLAGSLVPALRASRVDPLAAIRAE